MFIPINMLEIFEYISIRREREIGIVRCGFCIELRISLLIIRVRKNGCRRRCYCWLE